MTRCRDCLWMLAQAQPSDTAPKAADRRRVERRQTVIPDFVPERRVAQRRQSFAST